MSLQYTTKIVPKTKKAAPKSDFFFVKGFQGFLPFFDFVAASARVCSQGKEERYYTPNRF